MNAEEVEAKTAAEKVIQELKGRVLKGAKAFEQQMNKQFQEDQS